MTKRNLLLAALLMAASAVYGAYSYYVTDPMTWSPYDTNLWTGNGSLTDGGYWFRNSGSIISTANVPDGSSDYEVRTQVSSAGQSYYVHYLRASSDALHAYGDSQGAYYYAVEWAQDLGGSGSYARVYRRQSGVLTLLASATVPYVSSALLQSVITADGTVLCYLNGTLYLKTQVTGIASGKPGVGGWWMATRFQSLQLGPLDRVAPPAADASKVNVTAFADAVDLQWVQQPDDANGAGVFAYEIYRNGQYLTEVQGRSYTDATVSAGTNYTYAIRARDRHNNLAAATNLSVATLPAGQKDARRVGVRAEGTYWGGAGEQIDVRSGNVSFAVPLVSAEGRGGWKVPLALVYNSQNWRKDTGQWRVGQDVGYGFGWRLMAGSVTPVFSNNLTVHHWVYTDASGAEYRLEVNTGGVWSSREGTYVRYDANTNRLYFPDGTQWWMQCVSGGDEEDAGTRYPSRIEDTGGNYVQLNYKTGKNAVYSQSSARIETIGDVRVSQGFAAYTFTYNSDAIPHLTGITNAIGTSETFSLSYTTAATLYSPFSPQQSFGTAQMLQSVTRTGIGLSHTLEYGPNGAGELTKVIFPYQGELRWSYADFAYGNGRTYREVTQRQLVKQAGAAVQSYPITHPPGDSALPVHGQTTLDDAGGVGRRVWTFQTAAGYTQGLVTQFEQQQLPGPVAKTRAQYTWTQDSLQRPYVQAVVETIDPGQSYQKQAKTEQTLDVYGNVTQSKLYGFGSLVTPIRTFTNTYLATSLYLNSYITNRLLTAQVTDGTTTVTLVSNTYDGVAHGSTPSGATWFNSLHTGARAWVTQTTSPGQVRNFRYNNVGNLVYSDDGNGHYVDTAPSAAKNYARPATITPNGNTGLTETLTWDTAFLGLTKDQGANGAQALVTYDAYARLQKTTSPHGAETTYTYTNVPPTMTATTNGHWVKTTYDGFARPVKVERGDGGGTKSIVETVYEPCACSPLGKVQRVSLPYAPGDTVYWTQYTFDGLGRTVSVLHASGPSASTVSYQGATVTAADPAGKWKKYEKDALGNLIKTTEPNPAGGADWETTFAYNVMGQRTSVTMTRGAATQVRSWSYNTTTWRLSSETHPESGTTSYTYLADGRLNTVTRANGKVLTYSYDPLGRLTGVSDSSGACGGVAYTWDNDAQNPGNFNADGRIRKKTYGGTGCGPVPWQFEEEYKYSTAGLTMEKKLWLTGSGGSSNWVNVMTWYNNEGQATSKIVQPSWQGTADASMTYTYDAMARPSGLTGSGTVSGVTYNAADQITAMTHGGMSETRQYNYMGQLTRLIVSGHLDLQYRYSATQNNGQITSVMNWGTGEEVNYSYDAVGRVASATTTGPEWGLSFTFDGFGNKTAQTVVKGTAPAMSIGVDPGTNRVTGHSYDAAGFSTAMPGVTSMTWDGQGRMVQSVAGGATDNYAYDPSNQRVFRNNQVFVRGYGGELLAVYNFNPSTRALTFVKRYVYFAGRRVGMKEDRLGTVQNGSRWFPYGEESTGNGAE